MSKRPFLITRICNRFREVARRRRFAGAVEHLHGQGFSVPPGEVLAIVLVRDGCYYLDAFFDYYRALGIRYFAFVDNGSTDDTVARIKAQEGCVIDRVELPLAQYEDLMRQYPAQKYGTDRWCLYVDMDEQFDFEGREQHGLPALINYLEGRSDTALLAQMLEMFPRAPLAAVKDLTYSQALTAFAQYDISTVSSFDYHSDKIEFSALLAGNTLGSDALQFKFGGVRGKVFGEACCLTKHPLIFNGADVVPAPHPHLSQNVRVSDFDAVIRHYKFAGNVAARDAASAASGDLAHGEDQARLAVLAAQENLTLHSSDAQVWTGIDPLYDAGFLVRSKSYSTFLAESNT
ncbi:glycosyltransferase family 2 protein [Sulfitobacter guttiformis]|uniref:Glycosyl transferase family 2 n=1 Tax=Sulfitobacter guttiformis TaxID=74349 RepID=A0A420DNL7_9RHOB|nr:glycosyltransferase family 2 protein [Sulfitobacter guttiformis]KIN73207.1 Glyco tranf 2 4 domain containing protein [Sulfitobacter guttiformis KCTC 32187]RKE95884.1 glycosyl transferase family 2 [Sulfitobacter guttiformis]